MHTRKLSWLCYKHKPQIVNKSLSSIWSLSFYSSIYCCHSNSSISLLHQQSFRSDYTLFSSLYLSFDLTFILLARSAWDRPSAAWVPGRITETSKYSIITILQIQILNDHISEILSLHNDIFNWTKTYTNLVNVTSDIWFVGELTLCIARLFTETNDWSVR